MVQQADAEAVLELVARSAFTTLTVAALELDRDDWLVLSAQSGRGVENHRIAEGY